MPQGRTVSSKETNSANRKTLNVRQLGAAAAASSALLLSSGCTEDFVEPQEEKQFNEILQPVAVDIATRTLALVEAQSTAPGEHVSAVVQQSDDTPNEISVVYEVEVEGGWRAIRITTGLADGQPDPSSVSRVEIAESPDGTAQYSGADDFDVIQLASIGQSPYDDPNNDYWHVVHVFDNELHTGSYNTIREAHGDTQEDLELAQELAEGTIPEAAQKVFDQEPIL